MNDNIERNKDYQNWTKYLSNKIKCAKSRAFSKVNTELLTLYWEIGKSIIEKEKGWGSQVINQLSKDLKQEFPDNRGFSVRNLKYMRSFVDSYPNFPIMQVPLAQICNAWFRKTPRCSILPVKATDKRKYQTI